MKDGAVLTGETEGLWDKSLSLFLALSFSSPRPVPQFQRFQSTCLVACCVTFFDGVITTHDNYGMDEQADKTSLY